MFRFLAVLFFLTSQLIMNPLAMGAADIDSDPATPTALPITKTFNVNAEIITGCSWKDGDRYSIDFGKLSSAPSGPLTESVAIHLQCTLGANVRVSLGQGENNNGNIRYLALADKSEKIPYDVVLKKDGLSNQQLDYTFNNTDSLDFEVEASVNVKTLPKAGKYTDNLVLTVSY